ncbi:MAG: terpene cyclase/mutase family protein [Planctomycetes bacterium]|nr:terpene cyclase/mutase family protein [Planctomycetota bacterium]
MAHVLRSLALLMVIAPSCVVTAQEATPSTEPAPSGEKSDPKPEGTGSLPLAENAEALLKLVTTKEMEEAIRNGLKALSEMQEEDGGFGGSVNVAVTSLAGLALLGSGSLPDSGPYAKHLSKIVDYLLKCQDSTAGYITGNNDGSRIHGHGYATLFLSQVYGQSKESVRLKKALEAAVKCLEAGQTKEGGWGYVPSENTWDEGSTTICVLQGLRAAKDAGIGIKNETIAKAIGYIEKIAEPITIKLDGELHQAYTFMYSLSSGASSQSYALVAAACSCINNIGVYSKHARWSQKDLGKILDGGMKWMMYQWKEGYFNPQGGTAVSAQHHFFYANQYAAQAAWQYQDVSYFKYYFPKMQIPYQYLPAFQR